MEPDLFEGGQCRLILIGKTGNGKSSTGNSILGRKAFKSQVGINSATVEGDLQSTTRGGVHIQVMDTPGLHDTEAKDDVIAQRITRSVLAIHPGPHAIILCLACDQRFTPDELKVFDALKEIFGDRMTSFLVVVFAKRDVLEARNVSFEDQLLRCAELKNVLAQAHDRYVLFDNREGLSDEKKKEQVDKLLTKVKEVVGENGGNCFQHKLSALLNETMIKLAEAGIQKEPGLDSSVDKATYNRPDQSHSLPPKPELKPKPRGRGHGAQGELKEERTSLEEERSMETRTTTSPQGIITLQEKKTVTEMRQRFEPTAKQSHCPQQDMSFSPTRGKLDVSPHKVNRPEATLQTLKHPSVEKVQKPRHLEAPAASTRAQFTKKETPPQKPPRQYQRNAGDAFHAFASEVPERSGMRFGQKQRMVEESLRQKIARGGDDLNQDQMRELEKASKSTGQRIRDAMAKFKVEKLDKCSVM